MSIVLQTFDRPDAAASTFQLYDGTNIIKSRTAKQVFGFNGGDFATKKTDGFVYALNGKWDVGDGSKITVDLSRQTRLPDQRDQHGRLCTGGYRATDVDIDVNFTNRFTGASLRGSVNADHFLPAVTLARTFAIGVRYALD